MNDSSTFRTAESVSQSKNPAVQAKVDAKNPDKPTSNGSTEEPIALYGELTGKPYSSVYFEMDNYSEMNESIKDELELIDSAYQKRVQSGQYEDGKYTFNAMIKEAESVTDTKNSNHNIKIAKIAKYLKFIDSLDDIDEQHDRWS